VEDTIKKSREILCAAHNLKYPDHALAQDDKVWHRRHRALGPCTHAYCLLTCAILAEFRSSFGADRRSRAFDPTDNWLRLPSALSSKASYQTDSKTYAYRQSEGFPTVVAYDMGIYLYKTFAPVKQTTFTMVMAIIELSSRLTESHIDKVNSLDTYKWHSSRSCVVETMLDLLDLYTQFQKSTKIGGQFPLDKFIDVKIKINNEVENSRRLSRFQVWCDKCETDEKDIHPITPGSATSHATVSSWPPSNSVKRSAKGNEGTMRFVFDADKARLE
jgi:CTD kinase subunit beta